MTPKGTNILQAAIYYLVETYPFIRGDLFDLTPARRAVKILEACKFLCEVTE